ncbi:MAG: hypothetical protein HGGPFJEG_02197 [Ignavibacteria bacterium]|nr:hypothetical protein [Ignavibacteria bacterium]
MPTYEYKCSDCGHHFEVFQSMKEDKLKTCPNCGKESLARLIGTGGGLIFKGSGFYLTDYKNSSSQKSDAGTSAENKTETKSIKTENTSTENSSPQDTKTSAVKSESSKSSAASKPAGE